MSKHILSIIAVALLVGGSVDTKAQRNDASIQIHVSDSISSIPLVGARITIISGKDTNHVATNERGDAIFQGQFRTDTAVLSAHFLGYETKQQILRSPREGHRSSVFFQMVQSEQEIAEIVVVGELVAVVTKGDTVKFNAQAFKTFVNDPMSKLFDILPGMRFENGTLSYMGESIQRITIDGKRLFSDHVNLALEHIRADDVVDVRVFKTMADSDDLDRIGNRRPITVADVRTKSKPSYIHEVNAKLGGGTGLGPDHHTAHAQILYDASGKLVSSRVGQTLSAAGSANNLQRNPRGFGAANGDILYTFEKPGAIKFSTENKSSLLHDSSEGWSERIYFPTEAYALRTYSARDSSRNKQHRFSTRNAFQYRFPDQSIVGAKGDLSYSTRRDDDWNAILAREGGEMTQRQHINDTDHMESSGLSATATYVRKLTKQVQTSFMLFADIDDRGGEGSRRDTASASTTQMDQEQDHEAWSRRYGGRISTYYHLSPTLSASIEGSLSKTESQTQRSTVDVLTGLVYPTNSYDYRIHEANHQVTSSLSYLEKSKSTGITNIRLLSTWENRAMQRKDYFPTAMELPRTFHLFSLYLSADYTLGGFNGIKFEYRHSPTPFTLQHYRPLNDSDPLQLRAGNPNLKTVLNNKASATGYLLFGSSVYELAVDFETQQNSLVWKSRYFSSDTFLEEYNYLALAGSTLTSPENRNGRSSIGASLAKETRSSRLQMNIRSSLQFRRERMPVYLMEQPLTTLAHHYAAFLTLKGNFSSKFMPSLTMSSRYNERHTGAILYRYFEQNLRLEAKAMVFNSIELESSNAFSWNRWWPHVAEAARFNLLSNLSMAYLFDPQGDVKLSVSLNDLANHRQRIRVSRSEEYQSESYQHVLGRSGMIRLECKF